MPKKEDKKTKVREVLPLSEMTPVELTAKARQLWAEISKKKLEKSVGRMKNTRELFSLRKNLAKVKTLISLKPTK
jgi:ribosomal protein L29